MTIVKPMDVKRPRFPRPRIKEQQEKTFQWQPFPAVSSGLTVKSYIVYEELFNLHEIGADIVPMLLNKSSIETSEKERPPLESSSKIAAVRELDGKLERWKNSLPNAVQVPIDVTTLTFLWYRTALWKIILQERAPFSSSTTESQYRIDKVHAEAEDRLRLFYQSIAALFDWWKDTFGLEHYPILAPQSASIAVFGLIEGGLDSPSDQEIFHSMVTVLTACSRRLHLSRGFLRMIWMTLKEREMESNILESTRSLLQLSALEAWGPDDHLSFRSSSYPNYAVAAQKGRELADMSELLKKWAEMSLDT
ncbi:MAG: hypothetical protein Q9160_004005 [Pyrenula sp. 1 TL-2023]